jgi:hypothetical protein
VRRLAREGNVGAGIVVALDGGVHGGVAERVGLPGRGEHDDGKVRAGAHAELGGLLEEAVAVLGEAHVPLLSGHSVRLPLDLDLLQPQRIFPLPLPAGHDAEIRWISASTFSGNGWRAGGPSVMHPCYNTKSSSVPTVRKGHCETIVDHSIVTERLLGSWCIGAYAYAIT